MTPEERSLLERTCHLAEENNKILMTMNKRGRWSLAFRITYWVVILGLSFGAFYFIQPYVNFLKGIVSDGNSTTTKNSQPGGGYNEIFDLLK